jgi:hypothetical protein
MGGVGADSGAEEEEAWTLLCSCPVRLADISYLAIEPTFCNDIFRTLGMNCPNHQH